MVVNLSPKALFLANEGAVKAHRAMVDQPIFKLALSLALAQFAQSSPSAESLRGANAFTDVFLNLGESEPGQAPAFPHKPLQQPESIDKQLQEEAAKKTNPPPS